MFRPLPLPLPSRPALSRQLILSLLALALLAAAQQSARAQTLKADYQFQNNYNSSVPGATAVVNLINPLTGGGAPNTFMPDNINGRAWNSLRFPYNNGVKLTPTLGVIPNDTYSVVILFKFDVVTGFRRVIDVKNGTSDDGGAYVEDGHLYNSGGVVVPANTWVQAVGTRASDGTVTGYVNGVMVSQGQDFGDGLIDANNTLRFFQDDFDFPGEASAGNVARIRLYNGVLSAAQVAALDLLPSRNANPKFDFDGDGKTDISVFRSGTWYYQLSSSSIVGGLSFGSPADKLVPGDYDLDGQTDFAVFRNGVWYLQRSTAGFTAVSFGQSGDVPVPRDYDGDGICDIAVFRQGVWYILQSHDGFRVAQFGQSGDVPVPLDYDGDDKTDIAVFRNGIWYIQRSLLGFWGVQFGQSGDIAVPADYDGDNRTDFAVYRSGTWYLARTTAGFIGLNFGIATDRPVPADYDGDGKADIAVFRDGQWYIQRSSGSFIGIPFGQSGDLAVPAAYIQ